MKKFIFVVGLIVAIIFAYYCVKTYSVEIQNDIKTRLAKSFAEENFPPSVQAIISGRDVTLTGVVGDEDIKRRAGEVSRSIYGVRMVENDIQYVEPPALNLDPIAERAEPQNNEDNDAGFADIGIAPLAEAEADVVVDVNADADDDASGDDVTVVDEFASDKVENAVDAMAMEDPFQSMDNTAIQETSSEAQPEINSEITEEVAEQVEEDMAVADPCEATLSNMLAGEKINFATGQVKIDAGSYPLLNRLAAEAKKCDESVINIYGYTDNIGDVKANVNLSLQRAKSVGKYLISKGVRQKIRVVGNGPNDPIADNDTAEGRAKNRRIEFKVFKIETNE